MQGRLIERNIRALTGAVTSLDVLDVECQQMLNARR